MEPPVKDIRESFKNANIRDEDINTFNDKDYYSQEGDDDTDSEDLDEGDDEKERSGELKDSGSAPEATEEKNKKTE